MKLHILLPDLSITELDKADISAHTEMKRQNIFSPQEYAEFFSGQVHHMITPEEIVHIWKDDEIFKDAIYADVLPTLKILQEKEYTLGIFSTGVIGYQMAKIEGIDNYFNKEHIHVFEIKDEKLQEIIEKYKDNELILIDDALHILKQAKALDKKIKTIWIKRSELTSLQKIDGFIPDEDITSLHELLQMDL